MRPDPSTRGASELRDGALLAIVSGRPTPEEIAALVVALDTVRGQEAAGRGAATVPAWQRAALVEGVGGGPVSNPADLR